MGNFPHAFGAPVDNPRLSAALQQNFLAAATTAYVETASGLLIPKSIGDAKGDLIGFSAADTPVKIAAAAGDGYALTSDTSQAGGVVWSSPAAVSLYNPDYAGAATITNITERLLDWNTEAYDHGGFHAANATNIVVPSGYEGLYAFAASVKFTTCPAGAHEMYVRIRHYNSSAVLQNDIADGNKNPAGMNVALGHSVAHELYLAAGDYLTVAVWQSSGGNLTMQTAASSSRFTMHRVADL